jgi:hypothetical protein
MIKSTDIFNLSSTSLLLEDDIFNDIISCKIYTQFSDTKACFIPSKEQIMVVLIIAMVF